MVITTLTKIIIILILWESTDEYVKEIEADTREIQKNIEYLEILNDKIDKTNKKINRIKNILGVV